MVREQRIAVHVIPGVVVKGQKLQHTCLSPSEISAVIKQRSIYKTPSLYNVQYRKQSPTNESPTFRGLDLYRLATFCTIGVITKNVHPEYPRIHSCGSARAKSCYVLSAMQPTHTRHRGNTLFCRAVTSILSQWLLNNEFKAVLIARIHARLTSKLGQETQYLASIISDTFVNVFVAA